MKVEPEFVVHTIVLDEEESQIFNKKLPSDKDIDLFIDVISERDSLMSIENFGDRVIIEIESSFHGGRSFSEIKSEIKRIAQDLVTFINE